MGWVRGGMEGQRCLRNGSIIHKLREREREREKLGVELYKSASHWYSVATAPTVLAGLLVEWITLLSFH